MNQLPRIAFIGLGNMGGPMAANLVRAGYVVHAFDLSDVAIKAAREAGAQVAASAVDAARRLLEGARRPVLEGTGEIMGPMTFEEAVRFGGTEEVPSGQSHAAQACPLRA